MKSINDIIQEGKPNHFGILVEVLKKTGWPKMSSHNGKIMSIDEDTKITFDYDEDLDEVYISKIECNFATSDENHLSDLNGLVELFKELHNVKYKNIK